MDDIFTQSVSLHVVLVALGILFCVIMSILVKTKNARKKIYLSLPIYYMILSAIAFTGLVLAVITKMSNILFVLSMIFAFMYMLIGTIRIYKRLKFQKNLDDISVSFIRQKYLIDIVIYIIFIAISGK